MKLLYVGLNLQELESWTLAHLYQTTRRNIADNSGIKLSVKCSRPADYTLLSSSLIFSIEKFLYVKNYI